MVTTIAIEKDFDKLHCAFMIKILERGGLEGMYLNIIKGI